VPFLAVGLLALAVWLVDRELAGYRWKDVSASLRALPPARLLLALFLTVASYVVLTGYDFLALRYLGFDLPPRRVALASFLGYVLSHNVGLSLVGSSAPRYRLYTASGLSPVDVAKVVAFTSLTLWLGWLSLAGAACVLVPGSVPLPLVAAAGVRALGAVFLALVAAYVGWCATRREVVELGGWRFSLPAPRLAVAQVAMSVLDWLVASAVLFALLPAGSASYPHFLCIFLAAVVAGLISHVPGGLGVFESVVLIGLRAHTPSILGALLAFRIIYYLLPLFVGGALFATFELSRTRHRFAGLVEVVGPWLPGVVPRLLALATFASGAFVLLSGAIPAHPGRVSWLGAVVPLAVLEISHFTASLIAVGLLLLASGLRHRLDAAYHLTAVLLGAGIVTALLKGLDVEAAAVQAVLLALLLPCRRHFYRKARLLAEPITVEWAAAVAAVVCGAAWLGFFAFRHVDYARDLWWQFAFDADAPRFLRAGVGVVATASLFAAARLLRPARARPAPPDATTAERVAAIVAQSVETHANLAFLGDKAFLFSDSGRSFIMYAVAGRTWVAMGDPVGPPDERAEMVWRFRTACDHYAAWPVFYEVKADSLSFYLDIGLASFKYGEEARVPLQHFSLEGSERKAMRYIVRRAERDGATFEVLPAAAVPPLIDELRPISDAWLAAKGTREKRFSLGCFDPAYLAHFPLAVVRQNGAIVAFANLWCGAEKQELGADLMRYGETAPPSTMEYLFARMMLWGKEQGYAWFNMGMVPLSGMEDRPLAPLWQRLGALAYRHGEQFYNFQGLRLYKEKFDPLWRPKYLVCPAGYAFPRILAGVATIVSGGLTGVVRK
jgi:phosphatidylglycerol lysyltransferase